MQVLQPGAKIGIIGGGQLGRMMSMAAARMGYATHILTPEENSPAAQVSSSVTVGDYEDEKLLGRFAAAIDLATFEFENIPCQAIKYLSKRIPVHPSWQAIYIAQNRIREKQFLQSIGVRTAQFEVIEGENCGPQVKCIPGILKSAEQGYDGKWQYLITERSQVVSMVSANQPSEWVLESLIEFDKELSIIVARSHSGEIECFPPAENQHQDGILYTSKMPADIDASTHNAMKAIAKKIADEIRLIGVMAVEFFYLKDAGLLVNEIAPRPHNSGHWSMDACNISQFEQHIRAICGLPLIKAQKHFDCLMQNLIGLDVAKLERYLANTNAKLHLYGKKEVRKGRKMGHINIINP
ncbi:N5-carboxyaminoimidazole ribonucleotide synthase [Rickettsiales bacterium]|nr:N5-carboxyaminoimidazole ribonucleotide synthase [Rickettsiales bacterium]